MKISRVALAVALAFGAGGALAQGLPVTAATSVQLYGHLDLSYDVITKGIAGKTNAGGATATGKLGWQDDISSNLSYVGLRGSRDLGSTGLKALFQFEAQIDVSATPGNSLSSSSQDNQVKGALASRNSYLGIGGEWGAFKLGKTDAPYKLSTARMDPFSATIGDYNSIMGNTGGDNRAEFDTRISHAMWFESPNMAGFRVNALYAPGQNRSSDNSRTASGESSCTGGNSPGPNDPSGVCTDGSFGNAYSIAGIWEGGPQQVPLYVILAYEKHKMVNRTGDEAPPFPAAGAVGVVDENAYKVGVQAHIAASNTTINFIVERMTRAAPDPSANERQRNGFWLAATQKVSSTDDVNVGWAHAGKTPGDPGVGPVDNAANMLALGYKHHFDRQTNWYAVYARQQNHDGAHYDLGASGHGITTDCHDAVGNCFPGGKLQGISFGMQYNF
jgi:predicted porin